MNSEDLTAIGKAKKGDEKALETLFGREQGYIFNLMLHLSGDPALADDLTQEAFLRAYQHLNKFRFQSSFRTWLSKIAINLYRKECRKNPKHVPMPYLEKIGLPADEGLPARTVIKREMQKCILHALEYHLPYKYRTAVILRDIHELSYQEIAKILGWGTGKVKTRIHRGRNILRTYFMEGKCKAFAVKDYLCICDGVLEL